MRPPGIKILYYFAYVFFSLKNRFALSSHLLNTRGEEL